VQGVVGIRRSEREAVQPDVEGDLSGVPGLHSDPWTRRVGMYFVRANARRGVRCMAESGNAGKPKRL
jgi:hypothetical protein